MRRQTSLKLLSKRSRLNRRNYIFKQLGHTFRERSAEDVESPLSAEMQSHRSFSSFRAPSRNRPHPPSLLIYEVPLLRAHAVERTPNIHGFK